MRFQMWVKIGAMVVLCLAIGAISGMSTRSAVTDWYPTLTKPPLTPPSWVFGVAWTVLYCLMGVAAGIVWDKPVRRFAVRGAMRLFIVQLALNACWTPLFFGMQEIAVALIEIALLWIAVLATTVVFFVLSKRAGVLMVPYLLWTSFAVYLNTAFWMLNK